MDIDTDRQEAEALTERVGALEAEVKELRQRLTELQGKQDAQEKALDSAMMMLGVHEADRVMRLNSSRR